MKFPTVEKARASKCRFYPADCGEVIRRIKELGIRRPSGERFFLSFCNPDSDPEEGFSLVSLDPRGELSIFSLPDSVPGAVGSASLFQALQMVAEQSDRCHLAKTENHILLFPVRRLSNGALVIYERMISYQRQKFRGSQKYSGAFKAKVKKPEEREIFRKSL